MDPSKLYWICRTAGEVEGPFAGDQVRGMWDRGEIAATTQLCEDGSDAWSNALELRNTPAESVSNGLYRVLALLLGTIGANNFYAGETGRGAAKLLLFVPGVALLLAGGGAAGVGIVLLSSAAIWTLAEVVIGYEPLTESTERDSVDPKESQASPLVVLILLVLIFISAVTIAASLTR
ncbi:MAG: NINE protein [Verrucomicrobiales bacterium]